MPTITIHSNIRDYEVAFTDMADVLQGFHAVAQRCYVVDSNVWEHHRTGCLAELARDPIVVLPISEQRKSLETVAEVYDILLQRSAKRNLTLISIGGGILQDVTGFAASTLYRGINWIFVPTTLLAQADSCIGSKTSLNYRRFKNLIGTFYPPSQVFIHIPFLATLEETHFFSGVGEVVKLHIMGGAEAIPPDDRDSAGRGATRTCRPAHRRGKLAAYQAGLFRRRRIRHGPPQHAELRPRLFRPCHRIRLGFPDPTRAGSGRRNAPGQRCPHAAAESCLEPLSTFLDERLLMPSLKARFKNEYLDPDRVVQGMKNDKKRTGDHLALIMIGTDHQMVRVNDVTPTEVARALSETTPTLLEA